MMATAASSDKTLPEPEDPRGFTTAANNHAMLDLSSSDNITFERNMSKRLSVPKFTPEPITQDELGLDSTLVASDDLESCVSSGNPSHSDSGGRGRALTTTTTTTTSSTHQYQRKPSIMRSVMGRLRTTSVLSTTSAMESSDLHSVTSAKVLRRELQRGGVDPDSSGLIHVIMKRKYKKERKKKKLLLALLTYSNADVNLRSTDGSTALHSAVEECDLECARILVSFGASVNAIDQNGKTPLDLLRADIADMESAVSLSITLTPTSIQTSPERRVHSRKNKKAGRQSVMEFLTSVGAVNGEMAHRVSNAPNVLPFPRVPLAGSIVVDQKERMEILDWESQLTAHYSELDRNITRRLQNTSSAGEEASFSPDEAISLAQQLREMHKFRRAGSRILCLDGGGIRGLVQLEILSQLEQKTGRRITELFDWIIGSSTGAVIALGLVYAKKTTAQMRQLYFKMKDEIFGKTRHGGVSFNTAGLERILKEEFTEHRCMDDECYPRVLISAVKKDHINLKLHFFNNCFNDEFCKHWPVWKVARYTSAGPVIFGECDNYVDGGLLANNPSESGLTRILKFYRSRGEKLPISLVVSVGCGKYPIKELGNVDFLFFGSQGKLDLIQAKDRATNFMSLLSYALVEPSVASGNCKSRCEEQDIRYFRLNPRMVDVVDSGETDIAKLLTIIIQARKEISSRPEFANLILCLHELSEASRKMHAIINGDDDA